MEMHDKIKNIVVECTDYDEEDIDEIDLIENDIIDSLAFIEIIDALNEEFDIDIQPTRLPKDTWKSITNIVKMVEEEVKKWWGKNI